MIVRRKELIGIKLYDVYSQFTNGMLYEVMVHDGEYIYRMEKKIVDFMRLFGDDRHSYEIFEKIVDYIKNKRDST